MPTNRKSSTEIADQIWNGVRALYGPVHEVALAAKSKSLPVSQCVLCGAACGFSIATHWDFAVFQYLHIPFLYPSHPVFYWPYCGLALTSGFWIWGLYQSGERRKLIRNLARTLTEAGLKTATGRLPNYISDRPLDEQTRKLRLNRVGLHLDLFQAAKKPLESDLGIFIDEFKEDRGKGTVDIIYSHSEMPEFAELENIRNLPRWTFVIGKTRSKFITATLPKIPHLLVAGQTGGGKSTFLVQLVTVLYLNNKDCQFTIIDLKRGMEFHGFEGLERVKFISEMKGAVSALTYMEKLLDLRMTVYRDNACKDIEEFLKLPATQRKIPPKTPGHKLFHRHVCVIDEAAEMFLAGAHAESGDIQAARKIASQIARLGRSVGLHLVIATQRPDARALDPQVKANLTGVICFQMVNDASSMTVLGNGRATDLSPIPGRAIWKCGFELVEVQTPMLTSLEDVLTEEKTAEANTAKTDSKPSDPTPNAN